MRTTLGLLRLFLVAAFCGGSSSPSPTPSTADAGDDLRAYAVEVLATEGEPADRLEAIAALRELFEQCAGAG